ncbi:hypothetical protein NE237_001653 [Protea cynaroides]|uniref:1-(5-phosphoribosyl)-5-[(5-phosphoribosylamino)methylideneamino] imidazole-4-carboxamide isomerase HISN3, chloroplastic n=1 Tax=Protea cynaroides TaxID=273540 RepID=A0A9Q0KTR5_9MAGN|nr:hypothetical protein NE237_001653 [Protea cynaroides]
MADFEEAKVLKWGMGMSIENEKSEKPSKSTSAFGFDSDDPEYAGALEGPKAASEAVVVERPTIVRSSVLDGAHCSTLSSRRRLLFPSFSDSPQSRILQFRALLLYSKEEGNYDNGFQSNIVSVAKWGFIIFILLQILGSGLSIRCFVHFRPCIDIHKGMVKQIVGSTLQDSKDGGSMLITNFESDKSAAEFANMYKEDGLKGGHVIMLGADSFSRSAAIKALNSYPGGLQVGGGITSENAFSYLAEGASHVIVTSYVFNNGKMDIERLKYLVSIVGKQRLVLDLSCRKKDGKYAIVTDRWQKFSNVYLDLRTLEFLAAYADEFLVHGVDVEGKKLGIDEELVAFLGQHSPIPVTYAGGVITMDDLESIKVAGMGRVDVTVGSALDIFGGNLAYKDVVAWHKEQEALTG